MNKSSSNEARITAKLRSGARFLNVVGGEPTTIDVTMRRVVDTLPGKLRHLIRWRPGEGFVDLQMGKPWVPPGADGEALKFLDQALIAAREDTPQRVVFVFHDVDMWLGCAGQPIEKEVLGLLKVAGEACGDPASEDQFSACIVLATAVSITDIRLFRLVPVVELELPAVDELEEIARLICDKRPQDTPMPADSELTRVAEAARGLSPGQAEQIFAETFAVDRMLTAKAVNKRKCQELGKGGLLEIIQPQPGGLNDLGGLAELKDWFKVRVRAFEPAAHAFGLPTPKGVLLTGHPGGGKSYGAKCLATDGGVTLLRADLGRLMGGLVGQTEANTELLIRVSEAMAPCLLLLDEFEKMIAGHDGSNDSGVTKRMVGRLLTWLQEKEAPVFVLATCNDVTKMPAEMLRKGRFDEIFFIDLPDAASRVEILKIHLRLKDRQVEIDREKWVNASIGYNGAEIAEAVTAALFRCYVDGARALTQEDVEQELLSGKPLSVTMAERHEETRKWAIGRARYADKQPVISKPAVVGDRSIN